MKNIVYLLIFIAQFAYAQEITITDSLSRVTAQKVLNLFENRKTSKIYFSINDKFCYVLLDTKPYYEEYYVDAKNLNNILITRINDMKETSKNKSVARHNRRFLNKIKPFDLTKYPTKFDIKHNREIVMICDLEMPTYFVAVDTSGNSYGEFKYDIPTDSMPISLDFWAYMFHRVMDAHSSMSKSSIPAHK